MNSRMLMAAREVSRSVMIALCLLWIGGCTSPAQKADGAGKTGDETAAKAQVYLEAYNQRFQGLLKEAAEYQWQLNTRIEEGDTVTSKLAEESEKQLAAFTGSEENINTATELLEKRDQLDALQVKQLEAILYAAGANPATASDLVAQKINKETEQTKALFGHDFQLDGQAVTPNDLDKILRESNDPKERLAAWESSKAVGQDLKKGLADLQELRNGTVQALGYSDYFAYQVSDYGMTSEEMLALNRQLVTQVWPLYRELHTWARYTLAEQYGTEVPELLPAHWLPNRWGQDWTGLVDVKGLNLDEKLGAQSAEWIVKKGEEFYVSLGFDTLPGSFYEKSSLYPLPEGTPYKKNNHASAWHMDNDKDVRSLMSIEPNTEWWETTLHELGHIYYYMTYTNDDVPIILRGGANRAYHEAMGSLLGLASLQQPFLEQFGLAEPGTATDEIQVMLKEALNYIVFIPWSAGVMTEFEHQLYAENLSVDQYNAKWWDLKKDMQGIAPPAPRGEEFCDAASKTHINNDPAQYYDYALSYVLLFQFHVHIANNILKQDPHATNYFGSKETGKFLSELMYPGASVDWREHLQKHIGAELSAQPMVDYFAPLMEYLKTENEGREHTLPLRL